VPRVLHVFDPPDGGVAEHVLQLVEGLPHHGWESEIAGPRASIVYDRLPPGTGAHRMPFRRGYGAPWLDALTLLELVRRLHRGAYDIVHCHSAKAGVLGRIAGRITGVPAVYSPHCLPFIGNIAPARRMFATAAERALAGSASALICVCEDEREQVAAARLRPRTVHVVLNGCAPPADVPPDATLSAHRDGGSLAAAIAVMRRQKSLDVFIDAVPLVWERMPEARLALVGDGPDRELLLTRARELGLIDDPRFTVLPFTAPGARYLRAIDLFVLPSSWEGLPIASLEAMSCGVPQVATAVGGTPEAVVPETGVLVPPSDPPALAAAIADLLADPARRASMADAALERWGTNFRVERMVAETAGVYAGVLTA
jgi:glycosyltransferase involved in cell wall biosynthesis